MNTEENKEIPEKFKRLIEEVESMTVMELHQLVKILEKRFGVSAANVSVVAPVEEVEEEKSKVSLELVSIGESKIKVIKVIKEALGIGLLEARDIVIAAPTIVKEDINKEEAKVLKEKIEGAGGTVNLK